MGDLPGCPPAEAAHLLHAVEGGRRLPDIVVCILGECLQRSGHLVIGVDRGSKTLHGQYLSKGNRLTGRAGTDRAARTRWRRRWTL